jgi:hypothetical protein
VRTVTSALAQTRMTPTERDEIREFCNAAFAGVQAQLRQIVEGNALVHRLLQRLEDKLDAFRDETARIFDDILKAR